MHYQTADMFTLTTENSCSSSSSEETAANECSEENVGSPSYNRLEQVNNQPTNNHIAENIVSHQPLNS